MRLGEQVVVLVVVTVLAAFVYGFIAASVRDLYRRLRPRRVSIDSLDLGPADLLVVTSDAPISPQQAERMTAHLRAGIDLGGRFMVLDAGLRLTVVRGAAAERTVAASRHWRPERRSA